MLVVCKEIKPLAGYTHVHSFNCVYLVLRMIDQETRWSTLLYPQGWKSWSGVFLFRKIPSHFPPIRHLWLDYTNPTKTYCFSVKLTLVSLGTKTQHAIAGQTRLSKCHGKMLFCGVENGYLNSESGALLNYELQYLDIATSRPTVLALTTT